MWRAEESSTLSSTFITHAMPAPTAVPPSHTPPIPALYLYPLNDSFVPKHISLSNGQRVKIGRQTNAKTVPGERNGYFDSKVLSRQHAEVWEENGKVYIKDVKSSNGTFINGERLSAEGVESEPCDLRTDDVVVRWDTNCLVKPSLTLCRNSVSTLSVKTARLLSIIKSQHA